MSRFAILAVLALFASANPLPATTPSPAPLAVTKSNQVIHPAFSDSKCLSATNSNNAAVQIQDCIPNSADQLWSLTSSGQYIIHGNKCLDNTGGKVVNGNKLEVYTCFSGNTNQQWTRTGQAIQLKGTSKCMDLTDGNRNNGNVEQIYDCTGGGNQQWSIVDGNTVTPPTTTTTTTPTGPTPTNHSIRPIKQAETCLSAASNANNAKVVVEPCDGSASQAWTINGDGTIKIYGNKCLDVPNGSTANGVKMQIYTCFSGNTDQQFQLTASKEFPAAKEIVWKNHNECLDLTDGNLTNGSQSQLFACGNENHNQIWNII